MTSIATLEGTHNMHISSLGFTPTASFADSITYLQSLLDRLETLPAGTLDDLTASNVRNTIAPLLETLQSPPEGWTDADAANMMQNNGPDLDNDERILSEAEAGRSVSIAAPQKPSLAVPIAVAVAALLLIK